MASRSVSPGGALLRASRVFSIPPSLPRPSGDLSSQAIFSSDSATLPHPIHQSITTPQASLARGDWGFKRPLPLRSTTKTSTPFIRVEAIDTFEHITEFNSSADHALSLQKWQEMGVPLSVPVKRGGEQGGYKYEGRKSVFDDDIDSTTDEPRHEDNRWKFKGPWLAGQTQGDFSTYVVNEVRKRKLEFQKFMREEYAKDLTAKARADATAAGMAGEMPPAVQASDITDEKFTEYVRILRNERANLYRLIRSFLDLPPAPSKHFIERVLDSLQKSTALSISGKGLGDPTSPYAETGPPKTHPSAGLAYNRSFQHIYNHPVWGPQKDKPPVKARVVMPRGAATGSFAPTLGVGGFVTDVPGQSFNADGGRTGKSTSRPVIPGILNIEPDKVGGSKVYVQPTQARIDPKGRVILDVVGADEDAVAVFEGKTDKIPLPPGHIRTVQKSTGFRSVRNEGSRGYGLEVGGGEAPRPESQTAAPPSSSPVTAENAVQALKDLINEQ